MFQLSIKLYSASVFVAHQSSNYEEAILSNAFNEGFIDLLGLVFIFSSSGSLTTEDFCGVFGTGFSGTNVDGCDEYPLSVSQLCRILEPLLYR